MRHTLSSFLVVAGLLFLSSCSGCDPKKVDPTCASNGTACAVAGDCCTNYCSPSGQCADAPACGAENAACTVNADCCSGQNLTCQALKCQPLVCKRVNDPCVNKSECCATTGLTCDQNKCQPETVCVAQDAACTAGGKACCGSSICDLYSATPTNTCSPTACIEGGTTCNPNEPCCSGPCVTATNKCPVSGGLCRDPGAGCTTGSQCCSGSCDTTTATCKTAQCLPTVNPDGSTNACVDASQCCSGTGSCSPTTSGVCQVLPPGTVANDTCRTLGETCGVGTDCCSTNCKNGVCAPAYYCNASGDICYQGSDCCSGTCDLSNTTSLAGRCVRPNGGCIQDGNPCSGNSGCCTRLCADPGSGVTVCMSAPGCSMTGAYCDSTNDCCGGYGDAMRPTGYGIVCESSTSDPAQRCNNGQACNPPGNICGVSRDVNASQNCCMPSSWSGSGKPACKQDDAGIWRCFGAPNIPDVNIKCPTGYDGTNPECCIADGQACEINAQCCNGETCSQDAATGTFKCTSANNACLPAGTTCASGGTPCCSPYGCTYLPEFGSVCAESGTTGCKPTGPSSTCTTDGECCQHICDPAGHCALCRPTNDACTTGAECCGGICDMGVCRDPVCLPAGSDCSALGSTCCTGYTCETTPEFGKVCTVKGPDTNCAPLTTSCATLGCCFGYCTPNPTGAAGNVCETCKSNGDTCANGTQCCTGVCDPSTFKCADQCFAAGAGCQYTGDCCTGLTCYRPDSSKPGQCQATDYCAPLYGGCATDANCCSGLVCDPTSASCAYPATCATGNQGCGANAADPKCCTGTGLSCMTVDSFGNPTTCTTADTGCSCIVPPAACKTESQPCDTANPCCNGTNLSCVTDASSATGYSCQLPATCASPVGASCSLTKACCATDGTYCAETLPTNTKTPCNGSSTTCVCQFPG